METWSRNFEITPGAAAKNASIGTLAGIEPVLWQESNL
jgi:hypothetical protein